MFKSSETSIPDTHASGYEVYGMENLPTNSGGLLVYYHALLPYDMIFLACQYYLEHGKTLGGVVHYVICILQNGLFRVSAQIIHFEKLLRIPRISSPDLI